MGQAIAGREEETRRNEMRYRAIIDASPVPYLLIDGKRQITYLNPAFIQTLGYQLDDIPCLLYTSRCV